MQKTLTRYDDGVIARALSQGADELLASWRLVYYPPSTKLDAHTHDVAHFSALLAGQARETAKKGDCTLQPMLMEFKPAGFQHANEFGSNGALLLSINITQNNEGFGEAFPSRQWLIGDGQPSQAKWTYLAKSILSDTADADEMETTTFDLLSALAGGENAIAAKAPPAWLQRARDALVETHMSLRDVAADAGVHRAHLSRAFRQHFGRTISDYRHEARLSRAIGLIANAGASASHASHAAGFSDQSHLTRIMRRKMGVTPSALGAGLACL